VLYHHLPAVRASAHALAGSPARVTLAAPALTTLGPSVPAGTPLAVSGTLTTLGGAPIAGVPVEIQQLLAGTETTLAQAATGADGSYTGQVTLQRGALIRALHRPAPATVSSLMFVSVAPVVTLAVVTTSPLTVAGTVNPPGPHVTVELFRPGRKKPLGTRRLRATGGHFTATFATPAPGSYLVRATTDAGDGLAAGTSPDVPVSA
jgi:hypothetical protein